MAAKVRILALEPDEPHAEPRRRASKCGEGGEGGEGDDRIVVRRQREDTALRNHAYLLQTLPPNDPLVREIERRRSGSDSDGDED